MIETRTERDNLRFTVKQQDQKVTIALQPYHGTISVLKNVTLEFELLGGTTGAKARAIADELNEYVLGMCVTLANSQRQSSP